MQKWRLGRKKTGKKNAMRKNREEDRSKGLISRLREEEGMA
jgi:hypothetical protein